MAVYSREPGEARQMRRLWSLFTRRQRLATRAETAYAEALLANWVPPLPAASSVERKPTGPIEQTTALVRRFYMHQEC